MIIILCGVMIDDIIVQGVWGAHETDCAYNVLTTEYPFLSFHFTSVTVIVVTLYLFNNTAF